MTGYIAFDTAGSKSVSNVQEAANAKNAVVVVKGDMPIVYKVKEYVESRILEISKSKDKPQELSSADEIMKFKNLLDQGVITQEEFEAKKKQLLGL